LGVSCRVRRALVLESIQMFIFESRRRGALRSALWSGPGLSLSGVDSRPWSPPRHSFAISAPTSRGGPR
jgi:hypothetical protein